MSGRNSLNPAIWLVPGAGGNFRSCPLTERFRPASSLYDKIELPYSKKKINKLFTGFGSVRIVKNCDLGLENAALGLRPRTAFSRPRSQFFTIRTDPKPVNNIYISLVFSILVNSCFTRVSYMVKCRLNKSSNLVISLSSWLFDHLLSVLLSAMLQHSLFNLFKENTNVQVCRPAAHSQNYC